MKFATLVISLLILIAVLIPGKNIPDVGFGGLDKIVHAGMFIAWVVAVRYDFGEKRFPYLMVSFAGLTFSAFTEIIQILVEGRTFDIYDMIADALGVAIGLFISTPIVNWVNRFR